MLKKIQDSADGVEEHFPERGVLFIAGESYDAPTITVLQGLQELGFDVYTIQKSNINSWFCDQVVETPAEVSFDFVLSNLHWGTRWSHYDRFDLDSYPWVLIDGDDTLEAGITWRDKYRHYKDNYQFDPPTEVKQRELMPYRWVEPLYWYEPDIVFTSQKQFGDDSSHYLPFGLHRQYDEMVKTRPLTHRSVNLAHIPGPGTYRERMERVIHWLSRVGVLPGEIYNDEARGKAVYPDEIAKYVQVDDNVHSYHRWKMHSEYFEVLNDSRILVYPGIDNRPFWDSKRPWEALASGCFVMFSRPVIDVSEYPLTELCEYAVFNTYREFVRKYRHLYRNPEKLERLRTQMVERAREYFSPIALARYFLQTVHEEVSAEAVDKIGESQAET